MNFRCIVCCDRDGSCPNCDEELRKIIASVGIPLHPDDARAWMDGVLYKDWLRAEQARRR